MGGKEKEILNQGWIFRLNPAQILGQVKKVLIFLTSGTSVVFLCNSRTREICHPALRPAEVLSELHQCQVQLHPAHFQTHHEQVCSRGFGSVFQHSSLCWNTIFQFVPVAFCVVTGYYWEEPGPSSLYPLDVKGVLFVPSLQVFIDFHPPEPSLLQAESPISLSLSIQESCHSPFITIVAFGGLYPMCPCLSCRGKLRTEHTIPGVSSPVLSRGKGCLVSTCLMQPTIPLTFCVVRAHFKLSCAFLVNFGSQVHCHVAVICAPEA